jgi:hypothetical protein
MAYLLYCGGFGRVLMIDKSIYELYGLSEEEISIVKGG